MNNSKRYVYGMLLGMIIEYLYRVDFSLYPLLAGCIMLLIIIVDIFTTDLQKITK